tara:strand:- start:2568 stop:4997 length:2430 start_codon:yes stop_codon:yes gene_type:complete
MQNLIKNKELQQFPVKCLKASDNLPYISEGFKRFMLQYVPVNAKIVLDLVANEGERTQFLRHIQPDDCVIISADLWSTNKKNKDKFICNNWQNHNNILLLDKSPIDSVKYLFDSKLKVDAIICHVNHLNLKQIQSIFKQIHTSFPNIPIIHDALLGIEGNITLPVNMIVKDDIGVTSMIPSNQISLYRNWGNKPIIPTPLPTSKDKKNCILIGIVVTDDEEHLKHRKLLEKSLKKHNISYIFYYIVNQLSELPNLKNTHFLSMGQIYNQVIQAAIDNKCDSIIFMNGLMQLEQPIYKYLHTIPKMPLILAVNKEKKLGALMLSTKHATLMNGHSNLYYLFEWDMFLFEWIYRSFMCGLDVHLSKFVKHKKQKSNLNYLAKRFLHDDFEIRNIVYMWRIDGFNNYKDFDINVVEEKGIYYFNLNITDFLLKPQSTLIYQISNKYNLSELKIDIQMKNTPTVSKEDRPLGFQKDAETYQNMYVKRGVTHMNNMLSYVSPYYAYNVNTFSDKTILKEPVYLYSIFKLLFNPTKPTLAIYSRSSKLGVYSQETPIQHRQFLETLYDRKNIIYLEKCSLFQNLDKKVDNIVNMNLINTFAGTNSLLTEESMLQSNFNFILFGLSNLKIGGSFATVHCVPCSEVGKQFIYILSKYFSNIYCVKTPYGSTSTLNYNLIATHFQGIPEADIKLLNKISKKWELADPSNGHMLNISKECSIAANIESPYKFMQSIVDIEHDEIQNKIEHMINFVARRISIRMSNLFFIDDVFNSNKLNDSLIKLKVKLEKSQKEFVENIENKIYTFLEMIKKEKKMLN